MQVKEAISLAWKIDDIPYDQIDLDLVRHRDDIFYLLAASSFVEFLSDLTTRNLLEFFEGDDEVAGWLRRQWEHEEVQHGSALREYIGHVWPEFDWEASYREFYDEYSQVCTTEELEATRCLELAARCVVEMGTATYYRSLAQFAPEPVLRELATRIKTDEVRHYSYFFHFFCKYQPLGPTARWSVLGALKRRLLEVRSSDAEIALWHAFRSRYPNADREGRDFRRMFSEVSGLIKAHYPASMAVKMLLKPLELSPTMAHWVAPPISMVARHWILR